MRIALFLLAGLCLSAGVGGAARIARANPALGGAAALVHSIQFIPGPGFRQGPGFRPGPAFRPGPGFGLGPGPGFRPGPGPGPNAASRFEPPRGRVCFGPGEARDKIASHNLSEPFRAFRMGRLQGEPLRARLCRWKQDEFVYEVTVLRRDGRVVFLYMNAQTGQNVGGLNDSDRR